MRSYPHFSGWMIQLLIAGGCRFIGSAFTCWVLGNKQVLVVNLDALTCAGQPEVLVGVSGGFVLGDINDAVK